MKIESFREELLPSLVALQNRLTPIRRHMSFSLLKDALMDSARQGGKNVRVAYDANEIEGFVAWVAGNNGEFSAAPFVTENDEVARAMVEILLEQSRGQKWIQVSAFPEEKAKTESLLRGGFQPVFEFIEFETQPTSSGAVPIPEGMTDEPILSLTPEEFARLNNEAFDGVDNSLPTDSEEAREILSSHLLDSSLSRVWRDSSGTALAFSLGKKDGYLEAIGVAPSAQRKGLGAQLYTWVHDCAAKKGFTRIFATVSSRNEGSLRLHRRLKIDEVERRTVWEKLLK